VLLSWGQGKKIDIVYLELKQALSQLDVYFEGHLDGVLEI